MNRAGRWTLMLVLAASLAGCANYAMVEPQRVTTRGGLSVEPGRAWNKLAVTVETGPVESWTIDGLALHALFFLAGLDDGRPIFRETRESTEDRRAPAFRRAMTPSDVAELLEAALTRDSQLVRVETRGLRPFRFAEGEGFRFEIDFLAPDDIEREGSVVGAIRDGKLYLLAHWGTKLHHHRAHLDEFERIAASARLAR